MLYLVSTPIGNYDDISRHTIDTLNSADFIFCEDTRETGKLLKYLEIKKPLISFFEHNEEKKLDQVAQLINGGKTIAMVSDRGTPSISDPGFRLVRKAIENGIKFSIVPGPSAFLLALVYSGLPVHSFLFRGFPPRSSGKRRNFLDTDRTLPYTLIYYESPHRLIKFLQDAEAVFGNRSCCIANDLTKTYEKISRGKISNIITEISEEKIRGEFTVVIAGYGYDKE